MESYKTEIWHGSALVLSVEDVPDSIIQTGASVLPGALIQWYKDLSLTKKWQNFCKSFDEGRFKSGTLTHDLYTVRVTKKEER